MSVAVATLLATCLLPRPLLFKGVMVSKSRARLASLEEVSMCSPGSFSSFLIKLLDLAFPAEELPDELGPGFPVSPTGETC